MTRAINAAGLALIKDFEGLRRVAYLDGAGIPTIGYGHTHGVTLGQTCSAAEADRWLLEDLAAAENAVGQLVHVPLSDNQFAALVSFTFNMGQGRLAQSTLLKKLNAGDYHSVPAELAKWIDINGTPSPGLMRRRAAEARLWSET